MRRSELYKLIGAFTLTLSLALLPSLLPVAANQTLADQTTTATKVLPQAGSSLDINWALLILLGAGWGFWMVYSPDQ
jgi:hypothetical protein